MRVRLFAALRDLAGSSVVDIDDPATVGDLLDELGERYGERFATIAASGSVVVDGDRAERDTSLRGAGEIAVLPPVSGGASPRQRGRAVPAILGEPWIGSIASFCS